MSTEPESESENECRTCTYWCCGSGQCRYNPPTIQYHLADAHEIDWGTGYWPYTRPEDWCGKWEPIAGGQT